MSEWRSASKADFDAWHEQYKAEHGYPIQGRNALTGELVDVGWTTEYLAPIAVAKGEVKFLVDDAADATTARIGRLASEPTRAELDAQPVK